MDWLGTLRDEAALIADAPWSFGLSLVAAAAVVWWLSRYTISELKERLAHRDYQVSQLRAETGRRGASRKDWPKARFRRYLTDRQIPKRMRANQWALLQCGYEPLCEPTDNPMDMPFGAYSAFKNMKEAVRDKKLSGVKPGLIERESEIDRDELRRWLASEGVRPVWLFPTWRRLLHPWRF